MIPPTLKDNRRYIAFRLLAKQRFTQNQVFQAIKQTVLSYIGEKGYAHASFDIVDYNQEKMEGIARATDLTVDDIVFALTLLTDIQGRRAGIVVLGVSGTVRKAKQKYLGKEIYLKEMPLNK